MKRKCLIAAMLILAIMGGSLNAYAQIGSTEQDFNVDYYELIKESREEGVPYHSQEETRYWLEDYIINNLLPGNLLEATQVSLSEAEKEMAEMEKQGYKTQWYTSLKNPSEKVGYAYWKDEANEMMSVDLPADVKEDLLFQLLDKDPDDIYAQAVERRDDGKSYAVSTYTWNKYGILSYGLNWIVSKDNTPGSLPYKKGDLYRYHGYDANGNPYGNDDFPRDADGGRPPWVKKWLTIEQMRENKSALDLLGVTQLRQPFTFPEAEATLRDFLNDPDNAGWKANGWTAEKIFDTFLINSIRLDSGYIPGQFVGVHDNGGYWYQTFSIDPDPALFYHLYGMVRQIEGKDISSAFFDGNNLSLSSVTFLDSNNKTTTVAEAGKQYTAVYEISYRGDDMDQNVTIQMEDGNIKNKKDGSTQYIASPWARSKNVRLKDGQSTTIEVGPFAAAEASIFANGTLAFDANWNTNPNDDYGEAQISGVALLVDDPNANLVMKINSITPMQKKIYSPQYSDTQKYEISYTVNYVTAFTSPLLTTVTMEYGSNSNTDPSYFKETETVILEPGVNNRTFIASPTFTLLNKNYNMPFSLEVNKDRIYPEAETSFADNKSSMNAKVVSIPQTTVNPCVGIDKVFPGSSWTVTYNVRTKTGAHKETGYHGDHYHVNGHDADGNPTYRSCTCKRCVGGTVTESSITSTRSENFRFTAINFTSKDSGTVNLLTQNGKIKAGYGYELEIIARYTGSETPSRPATWGGCNYQNVSPGSYSIGDIPNTIYVVLPDGSIASNKAGYDFQMDCTTTSSGPLSKTLRCEVARANTYGNVETRKLYVHENTRNGSYNMTVCSAQFSGSNPNPNLPPLYDEELVTFVVDGKYTDDLTDHIIQ